MKALKVLEFGNGLKLQEVEIPKVKGYQVLVRVEACGICHTDLSVISGAIYKRINIKPILSLTPGHEISGIIEEAGEGVPYKRGDRVIINPWIGDGICHYCRIGEDQYCDNPRFLGISVDGGYAEYVLVPDYRYVYKLRDNSVSLIDIAPLACSGVTTYRAIKIANPSPNSWLMIIGVGGGLGSIAIQIAKTFGANIIGIDINEEGLKLATKLGTDYVTSTYDKTEILKITDGRGVDAIIDLVGSEKTMTSYYTCLAKLGKYIKVGTYGGGLPYEAGLIMHSMGWQFIGTLTGNRKDFHEVIRLAEMGKIKPVATKTVRLEEINLALENLERNRVIGRQILIPRG